MRIVSYNIFEGGLGRADPLAEVMLALSPDLVAIAEADDDSVLERLAARLEFECIAGKGRDSSVALLSRWPITTSINHALLQPNTPRAFLEAIVQTPSGEVSVGVVHFSPHATREAEDKRLIELQGVLAAFAPHRAAKTPHVISGDLNANAPQQQIDLSLAHPRTRSDAAANGGSIPRDVVTAIIAAGYIDSHAKRTTASGTYTTQHPQQRLDYIFSHGLRTIDAGIEHDRLAKYASDHFPIWAELA